MKEWDVERTKVVQFVRKRAAALQSLADRSDITGGSPRDMRKQSKAFLRLAAQIEHGDHQSETVVRKGVVDTQLQRSADLVFVQELNGYWSCTKNRLGTRSEMLSEQVMEAQIQSYRVMMERAYASTCDHGGADPADCGYCNRMKVPVVYKVTLVTR
jgi:hypothetical protein